MPNPLSERGFSDEDYAQATGTLVGEPAVDARLRDFQAIADVIANRVADPDFVRWYGPTVADQVKAPGQFSTWSKKEKNAHANATAGYNSALNPERFAALPGPMQNRVRMAQQALLDVFQNARARGITQGATYYQNPVVTAQRGTGRDQDHIAQTNGFLQIGAHRFTGPGLRLDRPFDPVTYNGMLGVPEAATPDFSDIATPASRPAPVSIPTAPVFTGQTLGRLGRAYAEPAGSWSGMTLGRLGQRPQPPAAPPAVTLKTLGQRPPWPAYGADDPWSDADR